MNAQPPQDLPEVRADPVEASIEAPQPAEKPKPKSVDEPVSKWTLVDYDDESAAFPRSPSILQAMIGRTHHQLKLSLSSCIALLPAA